MGDIPETKSDTTLKPNAILKERYKIRGLIKKSYVSRVYRGLDCQTDRDVAIKELLVEAFSNPVERKEALKQFLFESKILLKLNHPNLPRFEDYFEYNKKRYLIMEYIKGDKLSSLVDRFQGFWEEEQVIRWGFELCDVIGYLHTRKPNPIIFRGICPDNVIVADDGKLKLIDFGISKIFLPQSKTLSVAKTAKLHFSPMEQYTSQTNEKTDIYAIGATLYYLMTKTPPIDSIERVLNNSPLPSCKKYNRNVSFDFEHVIFKAMEVEQQNRYKTVFEMKKALEAVYSKKPGRPKVESISKKESAVTSRMPEKERRKIEEDKKIEAEEEEVVEIKEEESKKPPKKPALLDRLIDFLIDFLDNCRKGNRDKS